MSRRGFFKRTAAAAAAVMGLGVAAQAKPKGPWKKPGRFCVPDIRGIICKNSLKDVHADLTLMESEQFMALLRDSNILWFDRYYGYENKLWNLRDEGHHNLTLAVQYINPTIQRPSTLACTNFLGAVGEHLCLPFCRTCLAVDTGSDEYLDMLRRADDPNFPFSRFMTHDEAKAELDTWVTLSTVEPTGVRADEAKRLLRSTGAYREDKQS